MTPQRDGAPSDEPGAHAGTHGRTAKPNATPRVDLRADFLGLPATMYWLNNEVMASPGTYFQDAEQRARDRGCTCTSPVFAHLSDGTGTITTVVAHTSTGCPLGQQP